MSTLERMRRSMDSTSMRVIFGVVVLVFIFWGAGGTARKASNDAGTAAIVNGARITTNTLYREMRLRNDGKSGTSEEEQARFRDSVLDQLVQEELLVQAAYDMGIEVSSEEIRRVIARNPNFKDPETNRFSEELYERQLKRMGLKPAQYEESISRVLLTQKLQAVVFAGANVREADIRREYDLENTTAEVEWVKVSESALIDDVPVTDAEVDAFLAANELKVKERYDKEFDQKYKTPRKAAWSAILLRSDLEGVELPALKSKLAEIKAEADKGDDAAFAELAKRYSEDLTAVNGGDMGLMPEPLMDPPLATAIFAAGAGKVTELTETGRGVWIARVRTVEEAKETPFDEVKRSIARDMVAEQGVGKLAAEYAEKVLAGWKAAGSAPVDLLAPQGLSTASSGSLPLAGFMVPGLGANPALEAAVAAQKAPGVLPGVYPTPGGRVVASVRSYVPASDADYAAQRDKLRIRVEAEARMRFVQAWVEDLRKNGKIENMLGQTTSS